MLPIAIFKNRTNFLKDSIVKFDSGMNHHPCAVATRTWTIHVSQFTCQDRFAGGPPGCLQYIYDQARQFERFLNLAFYNRVAMISSYNALPGS